jgi:hypothetical protein
MLNLEHGKSEITELTDADLDAINGGNWVGDAFRAIGRAIEGAVEFVIHGFQAGPNFSWPSPTNPPRQPGQPY